MRSVRCKFPTPVSEKIRERRLDKIVRSLLKSSSDKPINKIYFDGRKVYRAWGSKSKTRTGCIYRKFFRMKKRRKV